jgi:hypothetical protein
MAPVIKNLLQIAAIAGVMCAMIGLSCARRTQPSHQWVMDGPCPDSGLRVWYPAAFPEHKFCEDTNISPAFALAIILNITRTVDAHKIHYHIRQDDNYGLVLTEYLMDSQAKAGERPADRDHTIHYHGVYVDLDTAKELIAAVQAHQHGAN